MPRQSHSKVRQTTESAGHPGVGLLSPADWSRVAAHFRLTEQEARVAQLIFEGHGRPQIAARLRCALGTVRVYINRVFDKLAVTDRHAMTLRVIQLHLADLRK